MPTPERPIKGTPGLGEPPDRKKTALELFMEMFEKARFLREEADKKEQEARHAESLALLAYEMAKKE